MLLTLAGIVVVMLILADAFETLILPRSVIRSFRLSRIPNTLLWPAWRALASNITREGRRDRFLGFYGPISVIVMIAIWVAGLIIGFALTTYGLGSRFETQRHQSTFLIDLYASGTTLFTLGLGDVIPTSNATRALMVIEAGTGLGFLAGGIAYLPVLYQSFSRRESQITLLDAWAGSPPSAVELFRRLIAGNALPEIQRFLKHWERWSAEVLESQISYPQVAYFRSQHGKQSWVSSLTTVLDVSALVLSGVDGIPTWQARLTFAIARHAAVDLSQILGAPPRPSARMRSVSAESLVAAFTGAGLSFPDPADTARRLEQYRQMYEPYVAGIAHQVSMELPSWTRDTQRRDNWEATPKRDVEAQHL